jgi:hypothetical protein
MNRTEYDKLLKDIWNEIEASNGNFENAFGSCENEAEKQALRRVAGVALMAADRYYSNLSRLRAERTAEDNL